MRHTICIRAASALRSIAAAKEALHFAFDLRPGSVQRLAPRIDHNGPMRIQPMQLAADGLADTPLDTVTRHRLAEGTRRGETNLGTIRQFLPNAESGEKGAVEAAALIVHSSEIFGSQQADTFRKTWDESTSRS